MKFNSLVLFIRNISLTGNQMLINKKDRQLFDKECLFLNKTRFSLIRKLFDLPFLDFYKLLKSFFRKKKTTFISDSTHFTSLLTSLPHFVNLKRCLDLGICPSIIFIIFLFPAIAEETPSCSSETLGVSRTIEIDTQGGPTFGQQYHSETLLGSGEVVLTFDDGPFPIYTQAILDALKEECAKATFFHVGKMVKNYPHIAQKVLEDGHTIGTHTWSHANLASLPTKAGISQVERAITIENQVLAGSVAPFFRFPYLSDAKRIRNYLSTRNIATFSIDVDSMDYKAKSPQAIVKNVMSGLNHTGGGIILFHDIHKVTAKALPLVLNKLKENNFKIVHFVPKKNLDPIPQNDILVAEDRKSDFADHRRRTAIRKKSQDSMQWLFQ